MIDDDDVYVQKHNIQSQAQLFCGIEHRLTVLGVRGLDGLGASRYVRKGNDLLMWDLYVHAWRSIPRVDQLVSDVSLLYQSDSPVCFWLSHRSGREYLWEAEFTWDDIEEPLPSEVRQDVLKNSSNRLMRLISKRFRIPWLKRATENRSIGEFEPLTDEQAFQIIDLLGQHFASA